MNLDRSTLRFLANLGENNHKDWFHANKADYEKAREDFISFIDDLLRKLSKFDPQLKGVDARKTLFRIYRDVRFSREKTPYKTNFGAHLTPDGRMSPGPGYYVHVEPGNKSALAGGIWMPEGPLLKAIRQEIDYNPQELLKILNNRKFKDTFGELYSEQLKTAPRGYPKDHPQIKLLRYKSFVVYKEFPDHEVNGGDFSRLAATVFKTMKPFNDFLKSVRD